QEDDLLNRDASYEKQFADRIERLTRPWKPGHPPWNPWSVFLGLAVVLCPVRLLWAGIYYYQQKKRKDQGRGAPQREQKPLRKQGDWGVGPPEQVKEQLAARQAQFTLRQGIEAIANHDYDEAIRLLSRYLNDNKVAVAYSARGIAFYHKKAYAKAITDYSEAIRLNPQDALPFNNLDWVLATCPDDKVRDGKRAVQYATKACGLSNWKRFDSLDTLAAAYAEAGNFKEAVKWQKQALGLNIENRKTLQQARQRLKPYDPGHPYRP